MLWGLAGYRESQKYMQTQVMWMSACLHAEKEESFIRFLFNFFEFFEMKIKWEMKNSKGEDV